MTEIKNIITCGSSYAIFEIIDSYTSLEAGEFYEDGSCEFQVMDYDEDKFLKFLQINNIPFEKNGSDDDIIYYSIKGEDIKISEEEEAKSIFII